MTEATARSLARWAIAFSQLTKQELHQIMTGNEQTVNEATGNEPKRQQIKQLLVGSPEAVKSTIYHFQLTGQAQIGEWSP